MTEMPAGDIAEVRAMGQAAAAESDGIHVVVIRRTAARRKG